MGWRDALDGREEWSVEQADAVAFLRGMPDDSVNLLLCSPPYERARLYLEAGKDLGVARGTEDWVAWLVELVCEASRVCVGLIALVVEGQTDSYRWSAGSALLMADLHRAGFNLRRPLVYKRFGICGSGGPDWMRCDHEYIVCVTRPGRLPWSETTACGAPPKWRPGGKMSNRNPDGSRVNRADGEVQSRRSDRRAERRHAQVEIQHYVPPDIANPGTVIDVGAAGGGRLGSPLAHANEAPYSEKLCEVIVRSWCPEDGVVCDPFSGSGTTGAVAVRWRRRFIGCDLRESQVALSRKRLGGETPMLPGMAANVHDADEPPTDAIATTDTDLFAATEGTD